MLVSRMLAAHGTRPVRCNDIQLSDRTYGLDWSNRAIVVLTFGPAIYLPPGIKRAGQMALSCLVLLDGLVVAWDRFVHLNVIRTQESVR